MKTQDYPNRERWRKRKTRTLPYICCIYNQYNWNMLCIYDQYNQMCRTLKCVMYTYDSSCNRCRVVFLSFFSTIFHYQGSLVFSSLPSSILFWFIPTSNEFSQKTFFPQLQSEGISPALIQDALGPYRPVSPDIQQSRMNAKADGNFPLSYHVVNLSSNENLCSCI